MKWQKVFHRIWLDEEERPEFIAWREKLQALHPSWRIRTWSDSSELTWLRNQEEFDAALKSDPFGRAPDILRYELLWRFGGVYIDTDFEPLRPFDDLLDDPRPFAAWENDRTMCTALLAAPKEHPAIDALIRELPGSLATHSAATPNVASGPEFATALWREREDVRRLPPASFYPVGWWEKKLLGKIEYPKETYAVHHWAKGWGKDAKPKVRQGNGRVSVLVPFRDVDGQRGALWEYVRTWLDREFPDAEIVVAADDGEDPFHKTLALNRCARAATGDVFVIWDADTICDMDALRNVIATVEANPARWGQPYRRKVKLNQKSTEALMRGEDWRSVLDVRLYGQHEASTTFNSAPPLVVHREAYEAVGGHDERFVGWGSEDQAFAQALSVLVGQPLRQERADCLHLNHPRTGRSGNDRWIGEDEGQHRANIMLKGRYRSARTKEAMRALLEERMVTV